MNDTDRRIFTNGVFDIIHRGHIALLKAAKALGGFLIVGVNSDASVRRLKGLHRPVNDEASRVVVLRSIRYVDEVVLFDEDTPYELIKRLKPPIIVKGGDYSKEEVVGNDIAEVVLIPYVNGYSTTGTVRKAQESTDELRYSGRGDQCENRARGSQVLS